MYNITKITGNRLLK